LFVIICYWVQLLQAKMNSGPVKFGPHCTAVIDR